MTQNNTTILVERAVSDILDEAAAQQTEQTGGYVAKKSVARETVIKNVFAHLTPDRKQKLIKKYPFLANQRA